MLFFPPKIPETLTQYIHITFVHRAPIPDFSTLSFRNSTIQFTFGDEVTPSSLTSDRISSTIDSVLKKHGAQFPHLEDARACGFKFSSYDPNDTRYSNSFKNVMKTARAATNPNAREVVFNVENLRSEAALNGRTLEKQLVLTLSNEACHILWGTSVRVRSVDEAANEIKEVWTKDKSGDASLSRIEKDILDRTYDEFMSTVVMRFTEICLDSKNTRPKLDDLLKSEKSFLDSSLSAHVDSGFWGVLPVEMIERIKEAKSRHEKTDEDRMYIAVIDRINTASGSKEFGTRFLDGIKKAKLPIDF